MRKNVMVFAILVAGFVFGCDDCEPDTTQCNGTRAEVCNADGNWELEADCSDIDDFGLGIEWTCCADPGDGLHSCLPVEDCGEFDGGE